jgi:organic radical activating enzyme
MLIDSTEINLEVNGWNLGVPSYIIKVHGCKTECKTCNYILNAEPVEYKPIELVQMATATQLDRVTITGGNPLEQEDLDELVYHLKRRGFITTVEMTGLEVNYQVLLIADNIVLNMPTPSSGVTYDFKVISDMLQVMMQGDKLNIFCYKMLCADNVDLEYIIGRYNEMRLDSLILDYQMIIVPIKGMKPSTILEKLAATNYKIRVIKDMEVS